MDTDPAENPGQRRFIKNASQRGIVKPGLDHPYIVRDIDMRRAAIAAGRRQDGAIAQAALFHCFPRIQAGCKIIPEVLQRMEQRYRRRLPQLAKRAFLDHLSETLQHGQVNRSPLAPDEPP